MRRSLLPLALASLVACAGPEPVETRAGPATKVERREPLPNVHALTPALISGGVPDGRAGFAELARLGVRTVISVDGAAPDLEGRRPTACATCTSRSATPR